MYEFCKIPRPAKRASAPGVPACHATRRLCAFSRARACMMCGAGASLLAERTARAAWAAG